MPYYLAYGSKGKSSLQFPELPEIQQPSEQLTWAFDVLPTRNHPVQDYDWFHSWIHEDGSTWFACAKRANDYILRFPDFADFEIDSTGKKIGCAPWPDVPEETIRHLFLDQVLPRVLSQREGVVLHGSALVIGGGAVVFMGESGRGKSTLGVSFSRKGFPLLTDDGLYVKDESNELLGYPSYPGVRLWSESLSELYPDPGSLPFVAHYYDKQRLDATRGSLEFTSSPVPLRAIYLLGSEPERKSTDHVQIWKATGRHAFREVAKGLHRFDVTSRSELLHQFDIVSRIVATVPTYQLYFQHDFSLLPATMDAILNHLDSVDTRTVMEA
jgi:hypothetical protein